MGQYRISRYRSLKTRALVLPSFPGIPIITLTPVQVQPVEPIHYTKRHLGPEWMSLAEKISLENQRFLSKLEEDFVRGKRYQDR
jgi:hypothetical protein